MTSINNRLDSNLTGIWVNFFTAAGIPSDVSATYALTFAENRIQNDMLLDLNKEYLRDMGITRMGDVIAILRHAKMVHESTARDKVLSTAAVAIKVPVAAVAGRATVSQPSSPASRILEHYTRNPVQDPSPPKRKITDTGVNTEAEVKKTRLIRFGAKPEIAVNEGTSTKQTVFARLGNTEPQKTIVNTAVKSEVKPIYSRLGSKQDTDHVLPVPKDALRYEGILKSPPVLQKTVRVTTTKNSVRRIAMECTMRADEEPIPVKEKLALPTAAKAADTKSLPVTASKSVKFAKRVEYKEIEAIKKVNGKPKFTPVFNKPERRLSMPEVSDVKARLGIPKTTDAIKNTVGKKANNLTITKNVFNRLGV